MGYVNGVAGSFSFGFTVTQAGSAAEAQLAKSSGHTSRLVLLLRHLGIVLLRLVVMLPLL
jgi:hypothetical protein